MASQIVLFLYLLLSTAVCADAMTLLDQLRKDAEICIRYTHGDSQTALAHPLSTVLDLTHLTVNKDVNDINDHSFELKYTIKAKEPIQLQHLELLYGLTLENATMMAEGFQSWSHSREMHKYNTLPPIQPMVAWITEFDLQGDYNFYNYSGKPGYIHSNSYTYLRHEDQLLFLGSVSEDSGYTYFKADFHHNLFSIYKDIDGKKLSRDDTLVIKIWITAQPTSHIRSVWETYASYYPSQTPRRELAGYSSWYDNYERITEEEVTRTLTAFKEHQYPIDVFQIDDGYQMQIGDWLHVNEKKFPRGMQQLAQTIADAGYLPGLWLAPFAVGINSKIVSEHSHWLITEPDGRFMKAGPNWGGFYALDIYHPEVETYLQDVLDVVIDTWGYRLLKLDFLFAAAMRPRNGKSRGEIMWDAMALIDKLVRKRALLLGSGVPLAYAWGRMDYCRVSSDVSPWWDHTILRFAHVRERVATANALPSTLSRWPMVAMFGNDPDVFFIRSTNNKLTAHERYTTVALNHAFGQITLMSDNVQLYTAEEHQLYASTFPKAHCHIEKVVSRGDHVFEIDFICGLQHYIILTNLSFLPSTVHLHCDDIYFEHTNVLIKDTSQWYEPHPTIDLAPHETRILVKVSDWFAGSTGHVMSGWEIASSHVTAEKVDLQLRQPRKKVPFTIYLRVSSDRALPSVQVDGKLVSVEIVNALEHRKDGTRLIKLCVGKE